MIRGYRQVLRVERRLHRVGQWRLPVPRGLPLAGLGWFALCLVAVLLLRRVPVAESLLGLLPVPLAYLGLPAGAAWALVRLRPDGRAAHRAGLALARHALRQRRLAGWRPAPRPGARVRLADLEAAPDCRAAELPRAQIAARGGPVSFTLRYPCAVWGRGRTLYVRQLPGPPLWRGARVCLPAGRRVRLVRGA